MGPWNAVLLIWKLQHKPSSPYALQQFSIIVQFVIAGLKNKTKMPCKGVAKARGRVLYSVYYYRVSPGHYELNRLQAD